MVLNPCAHGACKADASIRQTSVSAVLGDDSFSLAGIGRSCRRIVDTKPSVLPGAPSAFPPLAVGGECPRGHFRASPTRNESREGHSLMNMMFWRDAYSLVIKSLKENKIFSKKGLVVFLKPICLLPPFLTESVLRQSTVCLRCTGFAPCPMLGCSARIFLARNRYDRENKKSEK